MLDAGLVKKVHVEGWPKGCVFNYYATTPNGIHTLYTPVTRKRFTTTNPLLYTRAYEHMAEKHIKIVEKQWAKIDWESLR